MNEEQIIIVDKMAKYGGSFAKTLAECFYRLDGNNFRKLRAVFPEYWKEYSEK